MSRPGGDIEGMERQPWQMNEKRWMPIETPQRRPTGGGGVGVSRLVQVLLTVTLVGALFGAIAPVRSAHALPSSLSLPFNVGETWYVCQGYNGQASGTHQNIPALDLSIDSASPGPTGCTPATANSSSGKDVLAPAAGNILQVDADLICISFDAGGSALLGHMGSRASNGHVTALAKIGTVNAPDATNGGYAHIHVEAYSGAGCGKAPKVAFADATGARFQCAPDMPYIGTPGQPVGPANPANQYSRTALTRCAFPKVALVPNEFGRTNNGGSLPVGGFSGGYAPQFSDITPESIRDSASDPLVGFDTVALVGICDIGSFLANAQFKGRLESFVQGGHKLIIYDPECQNTDYSNFAYPFSTSNPGAQGAQGNLTIAENNELSSSDPSSSFYINVGPINSRDEVGDSNVFVTRDAHWCTDMTTTNILGVTGAVHAYAKLGNGVIVYNGLDKDLMPSSGTDLEKIWELELRLRVNPTSLPCGKTATRNVLIFAGGIDSASSDAINQSNLTKQALKGFIKDEDFLYFSYGAAWCRPADAAIDCGWTNGDFTKPNYTKANTRDEFASGDGAMMRHADVLDRMITRVRSAHPGENVGIFLAGYSLGGITESYWVASHTNNTANMKAVQTIVPIDSPIGGVNAACANDTVSIGAITLKDVCTAIMGGIAPSLVRGGTVANTIRGYSNTIAANDALPNIVTVENTRDKLVNNEGIFCPSRLIHQPYGPTIGTGGSAYPFKPGAYSSAYRNIGQEGANCMDTANIGESNRQIGATHGYIVGGHDECWVKGSVRIAIVGGRAGNGNCQSIPLNQGQTTRSQVSIGSGMSQVEFVATYGSIVNMSLLDPAGNTIDASTTADNTFHEKGSSFERYVIGGPLAGLWTIVLYGQELPPGGEGIPVDVWFQADQNRPPSAAAGPDIAASDDGTGGALVTLDGAASTDPDADPLNYTWTWPTGSASGPNPLIRFGDGTTTVTLVVDDGTLSSQPSSMKVTVSTAPSTLTPTATAATAQPLRTHTPVPPTAAPPSATAVVQPMLAPPQPTATRVRAVLGTIRVPDTGSGPGEDRNIGAAVAGMVVAGVGFVGVGAGVARRKRRTR